MLSWALSCLFLQRARLRRTYVLAVFVQDEPRADCTTACADDGLYGWGASQHCRIAEWQNCRKGSFCNPAILQCCEGKTGRVYSAKEPTCGCGGSTWPR